MLCHDSEAESRVLEMFYMLLHFKHIFTLLPILDGQCASIQNYRQYFNRSKSRAARHIYHNNDQPDILRLVIILHADVCCITVYILCDAVQNTRSAQVDGYIGVDASRPRPKFHRS